MNSDVVIREASSEDSLQVEVLVSTYFSHIKCASMDDFVVAEKNGHIIGAAAIIVGKFPEVHSVVVHRNHRGKGLGSALFEYMLTGFGDSGHIYVRTTSPGFFVKLGFRELERSAKAELWDDCATCGKLDRCRQSVLCLESSDR